MPGLDNYTQAFQQLAAGNLTKAIDTQLVGPNGLQDGSIGTMWYAIFFGVPIIMVYLKTENLGLPIVLLAWTIALYGYLIDATMAPYAGVMLAGGFAVLLLTVFWRDN